MRNVTEKKCSTAQRGGKNSSKFGITKNGAVPSAGSELHPKPGLRPISSSKATGNGLPLWYIPGATATYTSLTTCFEPGVIRNDDAFR